MPDRLSPGQAQTANGTVEIQIGTLPAIWLNDRRLPNIAVGFLADDQLGKGGLLGMNVLSRFHVTIDEINRLI